MEPDPTSASPTSPATKDITTADMTTTVTREEAGPKQRTATPLKKAEAVLRIMADGSAAATTIGIDNIKREPASETCRLSFYFLNMK